MVKASHLKHYLDAVYEENAGYEKNFYLNKLIEIIEKMDFGTDRGFLTFMRYVRALVIGENQD